MITYITDKDTGRQYPAVYYEPKRPEGKAHYNHIDVAVKRAVMTGVNQLCRKYAEQSLDFLETDLDKSC